MGLSLRLRRSTKKLLIKPGVNKVVTTSLASPLGAVIPRSKRIRIPVIGAVRVSLPGGRQLIMQTDGDDAIASQLFWDHGLDTYEPDTMRLFQALIQNSRTFFDIGANTGIYSLLAGLLDPQRRVFAFEPMPAIFAYLQRNIAVNKSTIIQAFDYAIADAEGVVPFYIPAATAVFPFSASTAAGLSKQTREIQVKTTTIDAFVAVHKIERIDFMKIDTETTEPAVLRGARETFRTHRPLLICEVLPRGREAELHAVLDELDYRYYWIADHGLISRQKIEGDPTPHNMNYLFAPAERVSELPVALLAP